MSDTTPIYAKLINNNLLEFAPKIKDNTYNYNLDIDKMLIDGYLPVFYDEAPNDNYRYYMVFEQLEDKIVAHYVQNDISYIDDIAVLRLELEKSDFKIVKCYEYGLVGKECPYDINDLHASREQLRDKINEIENKINNKSLLL